jgi:hypothetical protein
VAQWSGRFFKSLPITVTAIPTEGYEFDGWVGSSVTTPTRVVFAADDYSILKARFRVAGSEPYAATGYELWTLTNYTEQQINTTQAALPDEPSGYAGMSNFELYAFGMQRNDGLSDAQRIARASLSINALSDKVYVGFNRLNSNFADVSYKLRVTDNLHSPVVWRDALQGQELLPEIITNLINSSTWFQQQRLDQSVRPSLYLKLEVLQSPTD